MPPTCGNEEPTRPGMRTTCHYRSMRSLMRDSDRTETHCATRHACATWVLSNACIATRYACDGHVFPRIEGVPGPARPPRRRPSPVRPFMRPIWVNRARLYMRQVQMEIVRVGPIRRDRLCEASEDAPGELKTRGVGDLPATTYAYRRKSSPPDSALTTSASRDRLCVHSYQP